MERLEQLLMDLEGITIRDIAEIPTEQQHKVVEHLEALQDQLRHLARQSDQNPPSRPDHN